jgi:hypothetical protein
MLEGSLFTWIASSRFWKKAVTPVLVLCTLM